MSWSEWFASACANVCAVWIPLLSISCHFCLFYVDFAHFGYFVHGYITLLSPVCVTKFVFVCLFIKLLFYQKWWTKMNVKNNVRYDVKFYSFDSTTKAFVGYLCRTLATEDTYGRITHRYSTGRLWCSPPRCWFTTLLARFIVGLISLVTFRVTRGCDVIRLATCHYRFTPIKRLCDAVGISNSQRVMWRHGAYSYPSVNQSANHYFVWLLYYEAVGRTKHKTV